MLCTVVKPAVTYLERPGADPERVHLTYVSPQVERILGRSAEELIADPGHFGRMLHPDDREAYLAAYDVKAHLIRVFGFGGFDAEVVDSSFMGTREYQSKEGKDMVEVIYYSRVRLTVRDGKGGQAVYAEGAVGSASGPLNMLGEHHDNALKTAASDALKRCAINLGDQFGLSLYSDGSTRPLIKQTLALPEGVVIEKPSPTAEQEQLLQQALGAKEVKEERRKEEMAGAANTEGNS